MAGVRSTPKPSGKYQGWFTDSTGKQKYFTGGRDRAETLRMARRLEDDHRQVRLGYRPARSPAERNRSLGFSKVAQEYLEWGQTQGGRGGRPWSDGHARRRCSQLEWWRKRLKLKILGDLTDMQPAVERATRSMLRDGKSGKTVANYVEGLSAFCDWCVDRRYLATDPLTSMASFDTSPKSRRRSASREELVRILAAAPAERRLLYETAFVSGLRSNELRSLTVHHVDLQRGGLQLDAAWTKNRKPGFQVMPRDLLQRLHEHAAAGIPGDLYKAAYRRGKPKSDPPAAALLYVPSQPARTLYRDLTAAGVDKDTPAGRLDFHAVRVAYISHLFEDAAVSPKEVQELARHSSLDLSLNTYGRAREERLREAVERLSSVASEAENHALFMPADQDEAERKNATPVVTGGCVSSELAPAVGFENADTDSASCAQPQQNDANSVRFNALRGSIAPPCEHFDAPTGHNNSTSEHGNHALFMPADPDLADIADAWPDLSREERVQIMEIVDRGRRRAQAAA